LRHYLYVFTFPNEKQYFGHARDVKRRWVEHKKAAKRNRQTPIYRAIRKYGWGAIKKQVVVVGPEDYIVGMEATAIEKFNTLVPQGYNLSPGGFSAPTSNPEVAAKLSRYMIERWKDPKYRAYIEECSRNREPTNESRDKISVAARLRWQNPNYRDNFIKNRTGKGRGRVWITNGKARRLVLPDAELPFGWVVGMGRIYTAQELRARSNSMLGHLRITNGAEERCISPETPLPIGWHYGRKLGIDYSGKFK
jgi:group I intron endonuclease